MNVIEITKTKSLSTNGFDFITYQKGKVYGDVGDRHTRKLVEGGYGKLIDAKPVDLDSGEAVKKPKPKKKPKKKETENV